MRNMSNGIYHELMEPESLEIVAENDNSITVQYRQHGECYFFCFGEIPEFVKTEKDTKHVSEINIGETFVDDIQENFTFHNTAINKLFPDTPSTDYVACVEATVFYDETLTIDSISLVRTYVKVILLSLAKRLKERLRRLPINTKEKKVPVKGMVNKIRKFFGIKQRFDVVEVSGLDYTRIHLRTMIKNASREARVKLGVENQKLLDQLRVGIVFNTYYSSKAVERNNDISNVLKVYRFE